jgi:hypothetical protein
MDERRRLVGAGSLMSSDTNDSASLVDDGVDVIVDGECPALGVVKTLALNLGPCRASRRIL